MSIIQEALRKAQNAKPVKPAGPFEHDDGITANKPLAQGARKLPIVYFLLAFVLIAFLGFAVKYFSRVPPPLPAPVTQVPEPPLKLDPVIQEAPQVIPEEPAAKEPVLILSGIMHPKSGPRALINNMTVAEGESVEGATVAAISDDRVILKWKNSEITLRLQQ